MSITEVLLKEDFDDYGCYHRNKEKFLLTRAPFNERQKQAIQIVEDVLAAHGKEQLLNYLSQLARVEHGVRELQPWARDHVVHAVLTFFLGAYINEEFLKPHSAVDIFQWKLSGLLHDVGYPIEIAGRSIIKPFEDTINDIGCELGINGRRIKFRVVPENLEKLSNGINAFDLLQHRISEWDLNIDLKAAYNTMLESGSLCHGMISGLALLWVLDSMYQKYNPTRKHSDTYMPNSNINWSQKYFEDDIISSCTAVFIHNLKGGYFAEAKITRSRSPIAFLLRLSDCLQDWERPSLENQEGISGGCYDI